MWPSLFILTCSTGALATATCPLEREFWATAGLPARRLQEEQLQSQGWGLWDLDCANRFLEQTPGAYPHPSQRRRAAQSWGNGSSTSEQGGGPEYHQADGETEALKAGGPVMRRQAFCPLSSPSPAQAQATFWVSWIVW